ncbi:MAG TPA: hypothetical protein VJJ82_01025 [Candidatus Nanoarchaeia archaeon]|nr:hypothetical protein [Candidatus Nanoarchaeia archaeon]
MKNRRQKLQRHHALGNAILVIVVIIALFGVYYMFQTGVGKAFFQGPKVDRVIQRVPESCCCSTQGGKLFEVTAQVLKGADQFTRVEACRSECQGPSHSTSTNPTLLIRPGKCSTSI